MKQREKEDSRRRQEEAERLAKAEVIVIALEAELDAYERDKALREREAAATRRLEDQNREEDRRARHTSEEHI